MRVGPDVSRLFQHLVQQVHAKGGGALAELVEIGFLTACVPGSVQMAE